MTTQTETRTTTTEQSRGKNIALWVLQGLLAAVFVMAAVAKFSADPQVTEVFDAVGIGDWFRYLIGGLEVAGAAALLIPLLSGLAGIAFTGLMAGAVVTHVAVMGGESLAAPAVLLALTAVVAWGRRERTVALARRFGLTS